MQTSLNINCAFGDEIPNNHSSTGEGLSEDVINEVKKLESCAFAVHVPLT